MVINYYYFCNVNLIVSFFLYLFLNLIIRYETSFKTVYIYFLIFLVNMMSY